MHLKLHRSIIVVLFLPQFLFASRIKDAYEALSVFDYFKAKKLFYEENHKHYRPAACFGLCIIFSRTDNPFHNLDSAIRYAALGFNYWRQKHDDFSHAGISCDSAWLRMMAFDVGRRQLKEVLRRHTVDACNEFLLRNYLAAPVDLQQAVTLRDELIFSHVMEVNKSDSTLAFIVRHPQSTFQQEAQVFMDRQVYDESTINNSVGEYMSFIRLHPTNIMVNMAYQQLFDIFRSTSDVKGLALFVKSYPYAPQALEAWKLLFSLSVKAYSYAELKRFVDEFPTFPLTSTILKELELNKLVLYPYLQGDFTGYINSKGEMAIPAVYDVAGEFNEGLAVVNRNDTVFFINKENRNPFGKVYMDAGIFRNGIAPVKEDGQWHFINRLGQTISKSYDEIGELSGGLYVVREEHLYGILDQYGEVVMEPRFEKLGDFKNGFAYYTEGNNYGFVSASGNIHKAEYDWISDFDNGHVAVFKQDNKYGLVNAFGKTLLEAEHDLISRTASGLYIVVDETRYGFYDPQGCFSLFPEYDFVREKAPDDYTDGHLLKLHRKKEVALADLNGHIVVPFGTYEDLGFEHSGLHLAKKKGKYGYLDSKYTGKIPFRYLDAADFTDSIAIVRTKDKHIMLAVSGKDIFSNAFPIERLSSGYFLVDDEVKSIVNANGSVVIADIATVQRSGKVLIVTLISGEIRILSDQH